MRIAALRVRGASFVRRIPADVWFVVLALAIFSGALAYVMAPMADARFSSVDDHEIAVIIGPSQHIALMDVPGKISEYALESNGRFRPGYFTLRVVEATIAGKQPQLWYLDRFLLALVAGAALLAIAYGFVPKLALSVLPLMLLAGPQSQIWTMLGPQESYAVPIVLVGVALMRWRRERAGVAMLLVAGLVKENFVLLIPAAMVWLAWRHGRQAWKTILWTGVLGGLEAAAVAIEIVRYGDFYSQTRSVGSSIAAAADMLKQFARDDGWYLAGLLGVAALIIIKRRDNGWTAFLMSVGAFVLLFLPQAYFYSGDPSAIAGRYLFPALFFPILVAALGYWLAAGAPGSRRWSGVVVTVVVVSALLMVAPLRTAHSAAAGFSANTRAFQAGISEISALESVDPTAWIIERPAELDDNYEDDFAIMEFLNSSEHPPQHIAIEAPPLPTNPTPLQVRLVETLESVSRQGGRGFEALPATVDRGSCIEVDLGSRRSDTVCASVVVIRGV